MVKFAQMYTIFKGSEKGDLVNEFLFPVNENRTSDVSPGFPNYSSNDF